MTSEGKAHREIATKVCAHIDSNDDWACANQNVFSQWNVKFRCVSHSCAFHKTKQQVNAETDCGWGPIFVVDAHGPDHSFQPDHGFEMSDEETMLWKSSQSLCKHVHATSNWHVD